MRRFLPLPLLLVALALAGCSLSDDGPKTTETRHLAGFTRVDNSDSVDVRLHVGRPQRVRVRAGEKVIDDVRTDVRDGTLRVTFDHHGIGPAEVVVEASVPRLTAIAANGSGEVDADGIDAQALAVSSNGSGEVSAAGRTDRLAVDLDGSGGADLAGLRARAARVSVRGSGDADVRADERLAIAVDGSGGVHYHGNPALAKRVDGSGDVSRAD
jgi:putative autotransporter adhesin-like protein